MFKVVKCSENRYRQTICELRQPFHQLHALMTISGASFYYLIPSTYAIS